MCVEGKSWKKNWKKPAATAVGITLIIIFNKDFVKLFKIFKLVGIS